jgi:hypothetical protein
MRFRVLLHKERKKEKSTLDLRMLAYLRDLKAVVKFCTTRRISCSKDVQYLCIKRRNCTRVRTLAGSAMKYKNLFIRYSTLQDEATNFSQKAGRHSPSNATPCNGRIKTPSVKFISTTFRTQNLPIVWLLQYCLSRK